MSRNIFNAYATATEPATPIVMATAEIEDFLGMHDGDDWRDATDYAEYVKIAQGINRVTSKATETRMLLANAQRKMTLEPIRLLQEDPYSFESSAAIFTMRFQSRFNPKKKGIAAIVRDNVSGLHNISSDRHIVFGMTALLDPDGEHATVTNVRLPVMTHFNDTGAGIRGCYHPEPTEKNIRAAFTFAALCMTDIRNRQTVRTRLHLAAAKVQGPN